MAKTIVSKGLRWVMSLLKNKLVASLVMLVTGILYIVDPKGSSVGTVRILAVVLGVLALANVIAHLTPRGKCAADMISVVLNLVLIGAAIWAFAFPDVVEPLVRYAVGLLTILTNLFNIGELIKLEDKKTARFWLGLFVAVIMMGLGVAMLIASEEKIAAMQQGIGGFLIVNALLNIVYMIQFWFAARKKK